MIVWCFGKCVNAGCPENWKIEKKIKWTEWLCPCNISYGMQMEKICLTVLLLGTNHGCITTNPNQSMLQCNGNIPVHLQPKSLRSSHHLGRSCLPYFGILRENCLPICEAWCKCEFCILLWSFAEASGCSSQKTSRQLARGVLLHHDNTIPHAARETQERIKELQWELLEHPPYSPHFDPSDSHLFYLLKKPPWWQMFHWWRRSWNGGAKMAETTVKILICCRFRRTGKAMGQMYRSWWRIFR
jgi:hypothetical protein